MGGAARYAWRLAEALRDHVDLHVITSAGGDALAGAHMHELAPRGGRFAHYYQFPFLARREIGRLRPDVVHAFGDDWALAGVDVPVVRTFHGSSLSEARSSTGLRKINHLVLSWLEHYSRRRSAVAIAVGPESQDEFRCDHLMPPVVPPIVAVEREPVEEPRVVFLGEWDGRKRGRLAAEAVEAAASISGTPIGLTVIGPSADAVNWPSWVEHRAGLSDHEVQQLIRDSWLLLAPSRYEGFGIPAFEALSLGVRSLSTPNPGSTFIARLTDSDSAFQVIEPEELPGAIARSIEQGPWLSDDEAAAARAGAQDLITMSSTETLLSIYESVVRTGAGR